MASSYTLLENDGVITSAVNMLQGSWIAIRNRKDTKWAPIAVLNVKHERNTGLPMGREP